MEKISIAIIGGGASGLFLANLLAEQYEKSGKPFSKTVVFERGERVGRKLSATGNGQGNITNSAVLSSEYFSSEKTSLGRVFEILRAHSNAEFQAFWESRGMPLIADERGRMYPAGRQASALTDALRFYASPRGVELRVSAWVKKLEKRGDGFLLHYEKDGTLQECFAEKVILCAGGKAAKNFGTDGSAYALAQSFGHTVTPLYPSLVQLKTETAHTKALKGIRVANGGLTAKMPSGECAVRGDIIFTDYGISGDAVFRISAFLTDKIADGQTSVFIDFLPQTEEKEILRLLQEKRRAYKELETQELLFGVVNNQIGRAIMRRAAGDIGKAAAFVKAFPLSVTGSLGFDYAQVTKGGIPLSETGTDLESVYASGLYFAGEILDVDGQCGGFNLQWAYSSACTVANALVKENKKVKGGGTV